MMLRSQLATLVFLLFGTNSVSAFFSFANLLYSWNICHPGSEWCPVPHCLGGQHDPPVCDSYVCRTNDHKRECEFVGFCQGDADCISGVTDSMTTADYYDEENQDEDYSANNYDTSIGEGSAVNNGQSASASSNWMPYAMMGAALTGFIMVVIWRKRGTIDKEELSEELGHGEDLNGAVARHHGNLESGRADSNYVMA